MHLPHAGVTHLVSAKKSGRCRIESQRALPCNHNGPRRNYFDRPPREKSCDELRFETEVQHALPPMFQRRFGHSSFLDGSFFRRWCESLALRLIRFVLLLMRMPLRMTLRETSSEFICEGVPSGYGRGRRGQTQRGLGWSPTPSRSFLFLGTSAFQRVHWLHYF